ncbi:hypothetical protein GOV14_00095 [Candidatus Pacearchaeota archaeon]|nr:hypothetical protein [Candidatus Pacearchaeota archaeon]
MGVPRPVEEGIIIRPDDVTPSSPDMDVIGVCNPGAVLHVDEHGNEKIILLLRVIERTNSEFKRHIASPQAINKPGEKFNVRWEWDRAGKDARIDGPGSLITIELEERIRPTFISHLRLATSIDGINFKVSEKPSFYPEYSYENYGIEDARITKLSHALDVEGTHYKYLISYVAVSNHHDVCTAFTVTNDFKKFVRLPAKNPDIAFFAPSKDVVVFPKKFTNPRTGRNEFVALTRPTGSAGYMVPSIFLSYSTDLVHWGDHKLLIKGDEKGHVGGGPAPIECSDGWLILDHQHRYLKSGSKEYVGRAFIVDKENPLKILKKSDEFLEPHLRFHTKAIVNNVTFPSGAFIKDDKLFVYTGENDVAIGVHIYDLDEFMKFLEPVE